MVKRIWGKKTTFSQFLAFWQLIADSPDMGLVKSRAEPPCREEIRCLVDLNPLPDELLVLILSWVPGRILVTRCRLVCQRWRDLIDRPTLWMLKLKRDPAKRDLLEAALKVTGHLPQIEWCRLAVLEPFGRNLIKNPCGRGEEGGVMGWPGGWAVAPQQCMAGLDAIHAL